MQRSTRITSYNTLGTLVATIVLYHLMVSPAHASMAAVICQILGIVQNDLARAVTTMGVLSVAMGAALGKVSWGLAITVAVGTSIMTNAGYYAGFFGVSGSC